MIIKSINMLNEIYIHITMSPSITDTALPLTTHLFQNAFQQKDHSLGIFDSINVPDKTIISLSNKAILHSVVTRKPPS